MVIEINKEKKTYYVLLSSDESDMQVSQEQLAEMKSYKARKYTVAVLRSGYGDLFENMLGLLKDNRLKQARAEQEAEREASGV